VYQTPVVLEKLPEEKLSPTKTHGQVGRIDLLGVPGAAAWRMENDSSNAPVYRWFMADQLFFRDKGTSTKLPTQTY